MFPAAPVEREPVTTSVTGSDVSMLGAGDRNALYCGRKTEPQTLERKSAGGWQICFVTCLPFCFDNQVAQSWF
jgi:hypothetical protein